MTNEEKDQKIAELTQALVESNKLLSCQAAGKAPDAPQENDGVSLLKKAFAGTA